MLRRAVKNLAIGPSHGLEAFIHDEKNVVDLYRKLSAQKIQGMVHKLVLTALHVSCTWSTVLLLDLGLSSLKAEIGRRAPWLRLREV